MHDNTTGTPNRATRRHPPKATQPAYVGIAEGATYLGVGSQAVRKLIAEGKLPAYRVGNKIIRIRIADLENVLQPVPTGGPL